MTKTHKNILIALLAGACIALALILADYSGLFGLKKHLVLDFIEASFSTRDKATGSPILEVKVKCFQKNNENACTQKNTSSDMLANIRIPVQKIVSESLLFRKNEELVSSLDPSINIMFIHKNYGSIIETFNIKQIHDRPMAEYPVRMEKKF